MHTRHAGTWDWNTQDWRAGLNPLQRGEWSLRKEEIDEIIPAIEAANAEGIHAEGAGPAAYNLFKGQGRLV